MWKNPPRNRQGTHPIRIRARRSTKFLVAAPVGEGAGYGGEAVGNTGGGKSLPAFLIRSDPCDGVSKQVGHADEEHGHREQGVCEDGDEQAALGVFEESGFEKG